MEIRPVLLVEFSLAVRLDRVVTRLAMLQQPPEQFCLFLFSVS
jgi:hypothetical protein